MTKPLTDQDIARFIAQGGNYTYCEPQRVTRKGRIRNLGKKSAVSSRKGRDNKMGLPPKLSTLYFANYDQAKDGK